MSKRERTKEVFVELVNLQLAPHGKTYDDVSGDPEWYMKYPTAREAESQFQKEGVEILRSKLRMTKKLAQQEMSWFILQWGLTTNATKQDLKKDANSILKSKSGD